MTNLDGTNLRPQALRLEQRTRDSLSTLAKELSTADSEVTPAEATRGLCLLALELAVGRAGDTIADIFRLAASRPSSACVHNALDALLWMLDLEPCTTPKSSEVRVVGRRSSSKSSRLTLRTQSLRMPQHTRDQLDSLASELRAAGANATAAEAVRGLCLLALEVANSTPRTGVVEAFRLAAGDPSADGVHRALEAVQSVLDGVPSTVPEPTTVPDDEVPTMPSATEVPPSTIPNSQRAA